MNFIFPWQLQVFSEVMSRGATLPHALLLSSPSGCGLSEFAQMLARSLLCEQLGEDHQACGRCPACLWMAEGQHPDYRALSLATTEEGKTATQIPIDAVRGLADFLTVGGHRGGRRIILIDPAEALNVYAANALLKSLEEPGREVIFLVTTTRPERLLPTLRSRCQSIRVPAPSPELATRWLQERTRCTPAQAQAWLDLCAGAPLDAAALADPGQQQAHEQVTQAIASLPEQDPAQVAETLQGLEPALWLNLAQRWLTDLSRMRSGASPRYFPQHRQRLERVAAQVKSLEALAQAGQDLARRRRHLHHPLNPRLFCEDALLELGQAFTDGSRRPPDGVSGRTRAR